MMLRAQELGVGSVWVNVFANDEAARTLGLPEAERVVLMMPLGYPAEGAKPAKWHHTVKEIAAAWRAIPQQPEGTDIFATMNDNNNTYTPATLTTAAYDYAEAYLNFIHCAMVKVASANVGAYRSVSKTVYVRVRVV